MLAAGEAKGAEPPCEAEDKGPAKLGRGIRACGVVGSAIWFGTNR
jgi:hypothetical protein